MDSVSLKSRLIRLTSENLEHSTVAELLELSRAMLEHIGSPDPVLRDELIYEIFSRWLSDDIFTGEQLRNILFTIIDNGHLFHQIGSCGDDTVFTRSFSALLIPELINANLEKPFLEQADLVLVKDKVVKYMEREQDVRGYIPGKGWAHSAAHSADALNALAVCSFLDIQDRTDILNAIRMKVCIKHYTYINNEDDRLARPASTIILEGSLDEAIITDWLNGFEKERKLGRYPEEHHLATNVKCFLRALYLKLSGLESIETITKRITGLIYR